MLVLGAAASPGQATGTVRVIRDPDNAAALQPGDLLVAPLTAPAWTPTFAIAAAIVTDVGSPLAHASIIAREYGIPAVVGCGDATLRLKDGQHVRVDGNAGVVEEAFDTEVGINLDSETERHHQNEDLAPVVAFLLLSHNRGR